jgi:tetratricopeptide (TPR) repeat protein
MTTPARPFPSPLRWRFGLTLLLVALAAAGATVWYFLHRPTAPLPPDVNLGDADPAFVAVVEAARDRIRLEPASVAAWVELGKVLRATGYSVEAAVCFHQAGKLEPSNPRWPYLCGEALALSDGARALPSLRRAVELCERTNADSTAARLRLAETLLGQGLADEAEPHLRRALESDPANPAAHFNLGQLAFLRNDLKQSGEHLRRCLDSPIARQRASARLADVCLRQKDTAGSAEFSRLAASLPLDHNRDDPWLAECMQHAVGLSSRFRRIEQLEAQGRLREAVFLLRDLAPAAPDYRASLALGKDLSLLGDHAGAESALRAALEREPENVQSHYYLCRVLWAQAEKCQREGGTGAPRFFRDAAKHGRRAIARKSDFGLAHLFLGLSLKGLGERTEALAELRLAVLCSPNLVDPFLHLGQMLAEDGKVEEARFQLEQAARLAGPDDPRPKAALADLAQRPR